MANVKISQLPSTSTPQGGGLIPIVQDGTTYSTTVDNLVGLNGVSSFNTRDGAVTLQSGDVTGALGYTPVSPTTLANDLANYVPEARTITINGTSQDLAANQTWTLASGAPTYPFTGTLPMTAGDPVVINDDGTVSSVKGTTFTPAVNNQIITTINYGNPSSSSAYCKRSLVCPGKNNPNWVISGYLDSGNTLILMLNYVGDTSYMYPQPSQYIVVGSVTSFSMQFDPFNDNRLLVIYNQGGNMNGQWVYLSDTAMNSNIPPLYIINSPFSLGFQSAYFDFKFSLQYAGVFAIQYIDNSYYSYINTGYIYQAGNNSFNCTMGTATGLDVPNYWYGPSSQMIVMDRLEGEDTFLAAVGPNVGGSNINTAYLWKINAGWNTWGTTSAPSISVGAAQIMVDSGLYPYANPINAFFISNDKIGFGFTYNTGGMYATPALQVASFSGLTISGLSFGLLWSYENPTVGMGLVGASMGFVPMPYNKNYILLCGQSYDNGVIGLVLKVPSGSNNVTNLNVSGNLIFMGNNTSPDLQTVQTNMGMPYTQFALLYGENAVINAFLTMWTQSNYYCNKSVPVTFVNKQFNNQNLLGIAQSTLSVPGAVEILPFGNIDESQTGLDYGTWYLQDDGTITQNVTPTVFGRALSATSIKTANYPTL